MSLYKFKRWLVRKVLRWAVGDSNYIKHMHREIGGWFDEHGPNKWMAEHIHDLLCVFALEGHSGSSAPFAVSCFKALASFEPWGPLTGHDDEWGDCTMLGDTQQNKRCGHVFRERDQITGEWRAYDSEGRIFREPDGACFTNKDSRVAIAFPYTPKRKYVDVKP